VKNWLPNLNPKNLEIPLRGRSGRFSKVILEEDKGSGAGGAPFRPARQESGALPSPTSTP
jgi:hypothetical protein